MRLQSRCFHDNLDVECVTTAGSNEINGLNDVLFKIATNTENESDLLSTFISYT